MEALRGLLVAKNADLQKYALANLLTLKAASKSTQEAIDWQCVELNTESVADDSLKLLEGFCPEEQSAELKKMLEAETVYYLEEEPAQTDATPIKLRNNFFARLFQCFTKIKQDLCKNFYKFKSVKGVKLVKG